MALSASLGFLGSLSSAGIGALASNHSALKQYKYQRKLQEQSAKLNYDYGQKSLLNSPANTRAGLVKAGYNPMLAVQNSTSGANAGWTSTGQAAAPDYVEGISTGIANAQSFQRLKNETAQAESVADANYANADKAKAEKASIVERLPWVSKREKAEIGNIEKDSIKKEAEIHNIDETTRYIQKNYELQKALGFAGLDVQRRGQDKALQGNIYNADSLAETMRGTRTDRLPFGIGSTYYDERYKKNRKNNGNIDLNDRRYWHYY